MHHLPRFFSHNKRTGAMDPKRNRRRPRLDRRNAVKDIDYDAASFSSSLDDLSSPSSSLVTRSLDLYDRTSFRMEGIDGEFDRICRSLGLTGPEDFAIPAAAWEASKIRSSSDVLQRFRFQQLDSPKNEEESEVALVGDLCGRVLDSVRIRDRDAIELTRNELAELNAACDSGSGRFELRDRVLVGVSTRDRDAAELIRNEAAELNACCIPTAGGGIKGVRPQLLKPPPAMTLPPIDNDSSTWDLLRDFAPESERGFSVVGHRVPDSSSDEEEEVEERIDGGNVKREEEENVLRTGEIGMLSESYSFTTSNDDDSSSTTTEPMSNISPNGRLRHAITYWEKGELLGRGSFGSVYEGISDHGFFFAVKEVSLLDQGSQGKQSIYQLEQEIALLSQFEHENIVQYYGTDKDESNLYIFLELVSKGSLLNLYQIYHLKDSQVSAYTRQILLGLKYLHDRNVVHRDIKCANILVDVCGSVKLADFGLAKATKLNDVTSCKGTAFWMAPEVVNGKNQGYGLPADIWSLGCTVLEMLTSQIPYSDLEWMQALFKIGRGVPPSVSESLSQDARDFIMQCLQVNPDYRPTASQLLDHPFVKKPLPTSSGSASSHLRRRS